MTDSSMVEKTGVGCGEFDRPFAWLCCGTTQRSSEHLTQICGAKAGRMATNGTGEKQSKKRRLSAEEIGQMSASDMRAALTAAVSELEAYDRAGGGRSGGDDEGRR